MKKGKKKLVDSSQMSQETKSTLTKEKNELRKRKSLNKNKKEMEQECKLFFRLLNVDGLNDRKLTIIKEAFLNKEKEYNVICMTETHHRYDKQKENELISYTQMRDKNKRKGGGLQILMRDNKHVEFEERKKKNEEILEIDGICFGMEMKILLVYFDVRKNED